MENEPRWIDLDLRRVVMRDGAGQQWIYLAESNADEDGPQRGFPIVIGTPEALEIQRVLHGEPMERPMTHKLAVDCIQQLGARIIAVEISDLRNNTFYANLVLQKRDGETLRVDARPSDAIGLGMRAGAKLCVPEDLLEQLRHDES